VSKYYYYHVNDSKLILTASFFLRLLGGFYDGLSPGSLTRVQVDRFHNDLEASIKELSILAPYDSGLKGNPLLSRIVCTYEEFSGVALNFVEVLRGYQRDNPVYTSTSHRPQLKQTL